MTHISQNTKRPTMPFLTLLASLVITACGGSDGDSTTTTSVATTTAGSTTNVLCNYSDSTFNSSTSVNATSTSAWSCSTTARVLVANGLPDHAVGTFPNAGNPNTIAAQTVTASYTLTPSQTTTATELGGPRGVTAYVLNGVKVDAGTAGSCDNTGTSCSLIDNSGAWSIEALGQTSFNFGTDSNNAHVQPGGAYHYHGMPEGFITKRGGGSTKMTLIGWAADGFPVYARYGYSVATDASSALKVIKGSYQKVATVSSTRPATTTYALGTFKQDWEYKAGSGDLDECNGRTGVTPEFPNGTYHYYATDTYPYLQRCVNGTVASAAGGPPAAR
jgi:YHYH protein